MSDGMKDGAWSESRAAGGLSAKSSAALIALGALLYALGGCDTLTGSDPVFTLKTGGDDQRARVGAELREPLNVVVRSGGRPVSNAVVEWVVTSGGGTVGSRETQANEGGATETVWTLGPEVGRQTVEARASDADAASFQAFAASPLTFAGVVALGGSHTCAIDDQGGTYCWGRNIDGELGKDSIFPGFQQLATAARVTDDPGFDQLIAGSSTSCGITGSGELRCWGDGESTAETVPATVEFTSAAVGLLHACALAGDGTVHCWGANQFGQLGSGDNLDSEAPVPVAGDLQFTAIATGSAHTCAIATDGSAYCWGDNRDGQLGLGPTDEVGFNTPQQVTGGLTWSAIAAGSGFSCGLTTAGDAYCWGAPGDQLGGAADAADQCRPSSSDLCVNAPASAAEGLDFASLVLGNNHACGLTGDGTAYCWGENGNGQVGTGDDVDTREATAVVGDHVFRSLALGSNHSCGVATDDELYCWGSNAFGQLGTGDFDDRFTPSVMIGQVPLEDLLEAAP